VEQMSENEAIKKLESLSDNQRRDMRCVLKRVVLDTYLGTPDRTLFNSFLELFGKDNLLKHLNEGKA
tara:strand:- start:4284 stop:4484 length:201 start_codon:yes stop_codon:yes gene_type:complete